jgi:hypothetical protein
VRTFETIVVVPVRPELVLAVVRDRLPELVHAFDEVDRIEQLAHRELDGRRTHVVNEWRAAQRLPDPLARLVGTDEVSWIDRADWDATSRTCRWSIEPSLLTEHVDCHGTTAYEPTPDGRGSRVRVQGTFDLARGALRGLAAPLNRPLGRFVETLVTTMIPRNTETMITAAAAAAGEPPA